MRLAIPTSFSPHSSPISERQGETEEEEEEAVATCEGM